MKKHILSILQAFCCIAAHAELEGTQITSESNMKENALYLITYKTSAGNYLRFNRDDKTYENDDDICFYYMSVNTETEKGVSHGSIQGAASNSHLVQLRKQDGHWLLFDIAEQKYISASTVYNYSTSFMLADTPTEECYVTFSGTGSSFDICLDGSYIRVRPSIYQYQNMSSSTVDSDYKRVQLYEISGYEVALSDATGGTIIHGLTADVSLTRSLTSNYYNTLMLPFAVADYKEVFGTGAIAYGLTEATDEAIAFETVPEGQALAANTPYLLNGTFDPSPYTIAQATFDNEANDDGIATYAAGDLLFNGVYTTGHDLGRSGAFILYNNRFYICDQVRSMPIAPYRWYVTRQSTTITSQAKRLLINGRDANDIAAAIDAPATTDAPPRLRNLQGIELRLPWQQLPRGIYLRGNKKVVKR